MFNALFSENEYSDELLSFLSLTKEDVGRFRDCYLSKDGKAIIIYTRNGGGNREDYAYVFDNLSKHPNYIKDYDDDFDNTYASIEFSIPDEYKDRASEIFKVSDTTTGAEKFDKLFKDLDEDPDKVFKENEKFRTLYENLTSALNSTSKHSDDSSETGTTKPKINLIYVNSDGSVEVVNDDSIKG